MIVCTRLYHKICKFEIALRLNVFRHNKRHGASIPPERASHQRMRTRVPRSRLYAPALVRHRRNGTVYDGQCGASVMDSGGSAGRAVDVAASYDKQCKNGMCRGGFFSAPRLAGLDSPSLYYHASLPRPYWGAALVPRSVYARRRESAFVFLCLSDRLVYRGFHRSLAPRLPRYAVVVACIIARGVDARYCDLVSRRNVC